MEILFVENVAYQDDRMWPNVPCSTLALSNFNYCRLKRSGNYEIVKESWHLNKKG